MPDFPGEQGQLRSHEGRIWKQNAITILAPFGLVITAMTGVPPRVAEIIDTDVDSIPEFQPGHPEYTSNIQRRIKVEKENQINAQRRMRIVLEEWVRIVARVAKQVWILAGDTGGNPDLKTSLDPARGHWPRSRLVSVATIQT